MIDTKTTKALFDLTGKVALVTGGAGWLGSALSEALVEQGATVVVASRNLEKALAFASKLNQKHKTNTKAQAYTLDITNDKSVEECFSKIKSNQGRLDILVNNAYSGKQMRFDNTSSEDWNSLLDSTLTGYFRCCKEAMTIMKQQEHGSIINISSMYGIVSPDPLAYEGNDFINSPAYGAAKAGVIQMTKYIACFYGKDGIRANSISPGPFPHPSVWESKEFAEKLISKTALGRLGQPYELKGAIVFLASDASSYLTGHNLVVDGGWIAR